MEREALKLALEALEASAPWVELTNEAITNDKAITAIKEALAQPAQEPVVTFDEVWDSIDWDKWRMEPIRKLVKMIHSKTTPPQRPWVGLTPQDLNEIFAMAMTGEHAVYLASDKLKEKNNG